MKQVTKILFPIDLTESVESLMPWVKTFVSKFDATLYVMYVTQDLSDYSSFYVPHSNIKKLSEEVLKAAESKMAVLAKEVFRGFPKLETRVAMGSPAEKILELVNKEGIEVIVMGTHGRKGLERRIFGSVCDKVVRSSPIPVITLPPGKE